MIRSPLANWALADENNAIPKIKVKSDVFMDFLIFDGNGLNDKRFIVKNLSHSELAAYQLEISSMALLNSPQQALVMAMRQAWMRLGASTPLGQASWD